MVTKLIAIAVLGTTICSAAYGRDTGVSLQDQQQAACYDDAQRLCGDAMPDVDKVISCMKPKKDQVSAKCAAFYTVKD